MIPLTHILILSALFVFNRSARSNVTAQRDCHFHEHRVDAERSESVFIGFARSLDSMTGVVFIFFIIVVAAAEAVVGLSIILAIYRTRKSLNIDDFNLLKW